jgi:hypothetical protein
MSILLPCVLTGLFLHHYFRAHSSTYIKIQCTVKQSAVLQPWQLVRHARHTSWLHQEPTWSDWPVPSMIRQVHLAMFTWRRSHLTSHLPEPTPVIRQHVITVVIFQCHSIYTLLGARHSARNWETARQCTRVPVQRWCTAQVYCSQFSHAQPVCPLFSGTCFPASLKLNVYTIFGCEIKVLWS